MKIFNADEFKIACPWDSCGHRPFVIRFVIQDYITDSFLIALECVTHYKALGRVSWDALQASKEHAKPIPFACFEPVSRLELADRAVTLRNALSVGRERMKSFEQQLAVVDEITSWRTPT